jgi:hypothetical protein
MLEITELYRQSRKGGDFDETPRVAIDRTERDRAALKTAARAGKIETHLEQVTPIRRVRTG